MIEALAGFPDNVIAVACHGQVTGEDYKNVLVPAVEAALKHHDKVRVYYEIAPDFTAVNPRAVWEDIKVGVGHLTRWERIAVVSDIGWIRDGMQAFRFLIPGEAKVFSMAEAKAAKDWIVGV